MAEDNYSRLVQLAEQVFAFKNDPAQLNVDESVIEKLLRIHPATLLEEQDMNGPVAWVLLIPTTLELMHRFLGGSISEKQLFELTDPGMAYEAVYLCSALVLDEYRRKGIVKRLACEGIEAIRKGHTLKALFVWPFSPEGDKAAETISKMTALPLYTRNHD
jgi:hypothetical protein